MNVNDIGTMVRAIRVVKGLNQAELAEKSTVDPAYVSRLERGLMTLPPKYLEMIEDALEVSFDIVRPRYEAFAHAVLADTIPGTPTPVPGSASGDGQEAGDGN